MRELLLKIYVLLSIICVATTEILSYFSIINTTSIRVFWATISAFGVYFGIKQRFWEKLKGFSVIKFLKFIKPYRWAVILLIFIVLLPLFALAITVKPNNYDGITYHFGRIVFWIQNQNVEIFPTQMVQALYHNVGSEYLLIHVFLLTGSDKFLNLVQYSSMIGSVLGITLICKHLGLSRPIQTLSAIIVATLPIGILESTTIQNDYLSAFYTICFVYFSLKIIKQRQTTLGYDTLFAAASITLAGFTKYTGLMFAFPFAIWLGLYYLKNIKLRQTVLILSSMALVFILIFLPFFARNHHDFGHILAPKPPSDLATEKYSTDIVAPHTAIANASKYYFFHFALPSESANQKIESFVNKIHEAMGIDPNDSRISFVPFDAYFTITEDASGNWLAVVLLTISLLILMIKFRQIPTEIWVFTLCTLVGFITYAALIKWQLYHTRTHIHFFIFAAIIIAYTFSEVIKTRFIAKILPFLLIIGSLPYVYANPTKQLISVKYTIKYLLGIIPRTGILESDSKTIKREVEIAKVLQSYGYKKEIINGYPYLTQPPTESLPIAKRRELIEKMGKFNYEGYSQNDLISQYEGNQQYYRNHEHFKSIEDLLSEIPKTEKVVGLAQFRNYYAANHWMVCRSRFGTDFRIQYAYVSDELKDIPNMKNYLPYTYIWSDLADFSNKIEASKIDWVKQFGEYHLIKLKQPQAQPFYY